jgi:hypothetical protein
MQAPRRFLRSHRKGTRFCSSSNRVDEESEMEQVKPPYFAYIGLVLLMA